MSSDVFIQFLERKLVKNGIQKLVPSQATLEAHARRVMEQELVARLVADHASELQRQAATASMPEGLAERVVAILEVLPDLSWDEAVAEVMRRLD